MREDVTSLRERLLKGKNGEVCSGTFEIDGKYPCLGELLTNSPVSPTGKAGFSVGLQFESPVWQVVVSWHSESLFAVFLTEHPDTLLEQIERRLVDASLDWRTSKYKWR